MDINDIIRQTICEPGIGGDVRRYPLSEEFCAQAFLPDAYRTLAQTHDQATNSYAVGLRAYHAGICVPEPFGVHTAHDLEIPHLPDETPMLVMRTIIGEPITSRSITRFRYAVGLAKSAGFASPDMTYASNALYVPEEDRVYLIDYSTWVYAPRTRTIN